MALPHPTSGSEETGSKRPATVWIVAGVAALVAVGAGAFFLLGGESKPKKKTSTIVNVMPVLPPPPPPTPPPTPPPAPPDPVEPPPDAPEFVEETAPESPPEPEPEAPAPMGSNIQGDGPPDGFGLVGKGGGGMIGGRGTGGGGNASRFGWYAGRVQNAVTAALRSHRATRSSTLSIKARIWVDGSGRVTRASLEGSSGDREVDQALQQEILSGLQLPDPPPEGMPMPIVMRINAARP
jgi:TonB family protein